MFSFSRSAMFLERLRELAGDLGGVAAFDLKTFEHIDELAVFQNGDRRRRWPIASEVAARALGCFDISAREDRCDAIGFDIVLQRECDAGARLSRGATANGVHDDHQRSLVVLDSVIDLLRGLQLLNSEAG